MNEVENRVRKPDKIIYLKMFQDSDIHEPLCLHTVRD